MNEPVNWQHRVSAFARAHNLLHDPIAHTLDLLSEAGEIAKATLEATAYGHRPFRPGPELTAELGDALYSLLALAEVCGVDAEAALLEALERYRERMARYGSPRSHM